LHAIPHVLERIAHASKSAAALLARLRHLAAAQGQGDQTLMHELREAAVRRAGAAAGA